MFMSFDNWDKKYTHIDPDYLSGKSSWVKYEGEVWKDIQDHLFFVLGMEFLSQGIPQYHYTIEVQRFCNILLAIFRDENVPYLWEQRSPWDKILTYTYDRPVTLEYKIETSDFIQKQLHEDQRFIYLREYYVLWNGIVHSAKDLDVYTKNMSKNKNIGDAPQAISLTTIPSTAQESWNLTTDYIALLQERYTQKAIAASKNEYFVKPTEKNDAICSADRDHIWQYIARLSMYHTDIHEQYDIEMSRENPHHWKLAILSFLLSYISKDNAEIATVLMQKWWHIKMIASHVSRCYEKNVHWVMSSNIYDLENKIDIDFTTECLHALQKYYFVWKVPSYKRIWNEYVIAYKNAFTRALYATKNNTFKKSMINVLDFREDAVLLSMNEYIDPLQSHITIIQTEVHKHYPDYRLLYDIDNITWHDIFTYSDEKLVEYIDIAKEWLLKSCAIWLYLFHSSTLIEFSEKLIIYSPALIKDIDFGSGLSDHLSYLYFDVEGDNEHSDTFETAFNVFQSKPLLAVLEHRQEAILWLLDRVEEADTDIEYYENEYDIYILRQQKYFLNKKILDDLILLKILVKDWI